LGNQGLFFDGIIEERFYFPKFASRPMG